MNSKLILTAALFGLAACARTEPIPEDALDNVAPPEPIALDAPGEGAAPALTPGMRWEMDQAANAALFGADRGSPALSLQCTGSGSSTSLVLARFFPTVPSGAGTMTLTGGGEIASVPVSAEANDGRPGGRLTATLDIGDLAMSVAKVFRSDVPVNVSVTGAEPLVLMSGREVAAILDACVGPVEAEAADDTETTSEPAVEPAA